MHTFIKHIKCQNVQLKYLYVRSYMFRSNWTKLHGTQYTHHNLKYLLPQRRISYNDVYFLLINSTIL